MSSLLARPTTPARLTGIDARHTATVNGHMAGVPPPPLIIINASADHLMTIPGVSDTATGVLLAETGTDMVRSPTADHLLSD
jgi:hypothetical protein